MTNLKIKIDSSSFDKIASMSPVLNETIKVAISDSIVQIEQLWESFAKVNLRSGKAEYIEGLSIKMNNDGNSGSVILSGDFPLRLEKGCPPYDLKQLFSQSPKVKFSKSGGWYMDIPMRQGTPSSNNISSKLNNSVYNLAKKLPSWGVLRTSQGSTESWNGYQYTTSTYDYLTKVASNLGSKSLNSYMIWRRVSDKSNPMSWMHPGFIGVHLADQLVPYANSIIENTVNDYIHKVFGV